MEDPTGYHHGPEPFQTTELPWESYRPSQYPPITGSIIIYLHTQQSPPSFILHTKKRNSSRIHLVTSVGHNPQDEATTILWGWYILSVFLLRVRQWYSWTYDLNVRLCAIHSFTPILILPSRHWYPTLINLHHTINYCMVVNIYGMGALNIITATYTKTDILLTCDIEYKTLYIVVSVTR